MSNFIESNLDFTFFIYGLGYLIAAAIAMSLPRSSRAAPCWDLFGAFSGLIGLVAWLNWLALAFGDMEWFYFVRLAAMSLSFAALTEFGRASLSASGMRIPARWLYPPLLLALSLAAIAHPDALKVVPRYILGLTGGGLSALAFWRWSRRESETRAPLRALAYVMIAFSVVSGLIAARAPFFPANILNQETVLSAVGISLPFARALLALPTAAILAWYYSVSRASESRRDHLTDLVPIGRWLVPTMLGILVFGWVVTQAVGSKQLDTLMANLYVRAKITAAAIESDAECHLLDQDSEAAEPDQLAVQRCLRRLREADASLLSLALCSTLHGCVTDILVAATTCSDTTTDQCAHLRQIVFRPPHRRYDGGGFRAYRADAGRQTIVQIVANSGGAFAAERALLLEWDTRAWRREIFSARAFPLGLMLLFSLAFVSLSIARQRARDTSLRAIRSEERYRVLLESAPAGILVMDTESRILSANRSAAYLLAQSESELEGRQFFDLWPSGDQSLLRAAIERAANGERVELDLAASASGSWAVGCRAVFNRIPDESGIVSRIVGILIDNTEQHQAREETRRSEERYQQLFDDSLVGNYISSPDGRIWLCNQRFADILGFDSPREAMRSSAYGLYPDRNQRQEFLRRIEQCKRVEQYESDLVRRDGKRITVLENVVGRFDAAGKLVSLQGNLLDITERKRVQQELHNALELVRAVLDASPYSVLMLDINGRVKMWNPASEKMFGWEAGDVLGKQLPIVPESDRNEYRDMTKRTLAGESCLNRHIRPVRRDGTQFDANLSMAPVYGPDGDVIGTAGIIADISESVNAQRALRASEERLDLVLRGSRDGFWDWNLSTGDVYLSPRAQEMLGYPEENRSVSIDSWRRVIHADDQVRVIQALADHIAGKSPHYEAEYRFVTRSGELLWVLGRGRIVDWDSEGQPMRMAGTITDITKRKQAEFALRESEERYRRLADASPDAITLIDLNGVIQWCNTQKVKMFGYDSAEELIGTRALQLVAPEERGQAEQQLREILAGRDGSRYELTLLRRDGSRFEGEFRVVSLQNEEGTPTGILTIAQDVTERNRAAEALRVSEDRYRRIVETAREGVWMLNGEGRTTFVNQTMADLLGLSPEEMLNRTLAEFVDPGQRDAVNQLLTEHDGGLSNRTDFRLCRPDGAERWAILRVTPIESGEGWPEGTLVMVTDITDRKRSERIQEVLLRISEATSESTDLEELLGRIRSHLSDLLDTTNLYVALYDEKTDEYSFEYFADEFDYMAVGERRKLPRSLTDYVRRTGTALLADDRTFEDLVAQGEVELIGTPSPVWLGVPLRTTRGVVGVMALQSYTDSECYDVQDREVLSVVSSHVAMAIERKRALEALLDSQEQLRQSQKMEAIGRLAGGVAHDFNNLLTGILGYSEITMHLLGTESPLRENIEQITRSAERAAALTRQLLAFSRKQVLQPKIVCLNDVVADMHKMLRRLIGEDIELVMDPDPELGRVRTDPGQIEQVILNLAVNARDAMPQGGRLTIETRNVELHSQQRRELADLPAGNYVLLSVGDSGTGIAPDILPHIFEPFFTTKERGKGTGLGLSTVYGIVTQSGGRIIADSESGHGTTFRVYLPRTDGEHEPHREEKPSTSASGGTETVLLVEDEGHVRQLIERLLRDRGYTVYSAESGAEALEIAGRLDGTIDLLVTDVVMPQMSGLELAEVLIESDPDLKVLFISGYADEAARLSETPVHNGAFLAKPFAADALARKIRELMDSRAIPDI